MARALGLESRDNQPSHECRIESLPPDAKVEMLDMLAESGIESREWWERVLCGFEVPDAPPEE